MCEQEQKQIEELQAQLAQMQRQLMQSEKMGTVGVLASSITHEFNNILTTVINYAKMGLRHQDPETREKSFNKILTAGQRAAKITTGMLSYARSSGDRRDVLNLKSIVEDVLVLVEKDLQKHRITLAQQLTDVSAEVNANQIQQIVLNLIINAKQAMEPGGTLTLASTSNEKDGWAELTVQDSGCGISADKLPHIFDSFFTTKVADENGQGGSGLGLALCKEIVEAHHGRIRVQSTPGKGTAFTLKLPLAKTTGLLRAEVNKAG